MRKIVAAFSVLLALSGCATSWVVDSDVRSHGTVADFVPGATYRFERLPSQNDSDSARAAQTALEAMAAPALAAVGLQPELSTPRYSVQVSARVSRVLSPWDSAWIEGHWHRPWPTVGIWGRGWYGPPPQPWYLREVSVVMRRLPGNEVVYETHARHDGPYHLNPPIFTAMFRAALHGFPHAPAGVRRVNIALDELSDRHSEAHRQPTRLDPAPASRP